MCYGWQSCVNCMHLNDKDAKSLSRNKTHEVTVPTQARRSPGTAFQLLISSTGEDYAGRHQAAEI